MHNEIQGIPSNSVLSQRVTLNTLGDGYVEAVPDSALLEIALRQKRQTYGAIHGECALTSPGRDEGSGNRIGRFGWKAEHITILSASASAAFHELGLPNDLFSFQKMSGPAHSQPSHISMSDMLALASFIRASEPIAPDAGRSASDAAIAGKLLFTKIGCSVCHVTTLRTAPAGFVIDGKKLIVSAIIGDKDFHPYSDYLLHDIGTGSVQQGIGSYLQQKPEKFRTSPLWGVRYRSWMMHDGKSITYHQAIMRHSGEASQIIKAYTNLTPFEKEQLRLFLDSL